MSTNGTIRLISTEKNILMYNHFDSDIYTLGNQILNDIYYLLCFFPKEELIYKINKIKVVKYPYIAAEEDIAKYSKYSDITIGSRKLTDYYTLLYKLQGDIKNTIEELIALEYSHERKYHYELDFVNEIFKVNTPDLKDEYKFKTYLKFTK